jgi:hypothetical protein
MPASVFTMYLPVLSSGLLVILQIVWKISLALSCIGLFTRVSTVSSFVLGLYLLGLPHGFGKVGHSDAIVVLVLAILALSRCGDAFSVDRWLRDKHQGGDETPVQRPQASGEYTWPVRAVWTVFALIFFAAGVSKLRHSGLEWIFSDNMSVMMMRQNAFHTADVDPVVSWGLALAQFVWLTQLLAAGTIVLEVGYPLALFSRRARWFIVPGVFFMQVAIRLLIGPAFYQFLICNLFWVPWDCVYSRFSKGFRKLMLRRHSVSYAKEPARLGRRAVRLMDVAARAHSETFRR